MTAGIQVTPPTSLPTVYQQVCLPAGRMALQRVLAGFQGASSSEWQRSSDASLQAGSPAAAAFAQSNTHHGQPTAAAFGQACGPSDASQAESAAMHRRRGAAGMMHVDQGAIQQSPRQHSGMSAPLQANGVAYDSSNSSSREHSGSAAAAASHPAKSESQAVSRAAVAGSFWEEFSGSIHLLCLAEIKYAMMAQSVVGVPGVMTLLCNLSTTVDFARDTFQLQHREVCASVGIVAKGLWGGVTLVARVCRARTRIAKIMHMCEGVGSATGSSLEIPHNASVPSGPVKLTR
jgi:hypothetical protein